MNIQSTADVNYFNDVFADDENYNDSDESPNINDANNHNEEIDDIGYNITDAQKSKQKTAKPKQKEDSKAKDPKKPDSKSKSEPKQKQERDKDEQKYSDRIKPIEEPGNDPDKPIEETKQEDEPKPIEDKPVDPPESLIEKEPSKQPSKQKKKQNHPEQPAKVDLKITKAKDGLNIEISDGSLNDIGAPNKIKNQDPNKSKKNNKNGKIATVYDYEDLNKTRKIHSNLLKDYDGGDQDSKENEGKENISGNNISIGKLTKECEDEINEKLQLIKEEKARLELEQLNRKKKNSKSKNRPNNTGQKSTREGYMQNKKKRPHSHKKRGSATMMQELKKKMGFINSQTSRGRTGGDKFLNYSLDEINQKLQSNIQNMWSEEQKGMKKRLNKSFENVFSAWASTSRTKQNLKRSKKIKKKPISSSPRRTSVNNKRNENTTVKTPNTTSRKKLNSSLHSNRNYGGNGPKEFSDKLWLINFSSMPSTPTGNTFIKKLAEKWNIMKAEKEKLIYNFCKKQLSLTNPNMGAILKAIVPNEKKVKNLKLIK